MNKIAHIGGYQRIQDVRIPRTSREAWGLDLELEKSEGLPRPLWQDYAAAVGIIAFVISAIVIARVML
jgi:hypothetical protein